MTLTAKGCGFARKFSLGGHFSPFWHQRHVKNFAWYITDEISEVMLLPGCIPERSPGSLGDNSEHSRKGDQSNAASGSGLGG